MSDPRSPSERLLAELRRELRPLGRRARRRALAEARDHLVSAIEAGVDEARAVERFGEPVVIAARLRSAHPRRAGRFVPVAIGAAIIVGTLALPTGPLRDDLAPQPAAAAPRPPVNAARCLASWNTGANAGWHSYAVTLGARRAWIGASIGSRLQNHRLVPWKSACVVKLWLAYKPGHWQNAIYIYGPWENGIAYYGTPVSPGATRSPHPARQRTTIQFSNARVLPDGRLRAVR